MKIIISGLGEVGSHLADLLVERGHELVLIDPNAESIVGLAEKIDARVIQGSATSVFTLKKADVEESDLFLCLTPIDEVNLVACSLAKALGARKVAARYHAAARVEHQAFPYDQHFKIDYFVSPERLAAAFLAKEIRSPISPVVEQFARGSIEVTQVWLPEKFPHIDKALKDIRLPARCRVGIIRRENKVIVPGGSECLRPGDQLVLIGEPAALREASNVLGVARSKTKRKLTIYGADDVSCALLEYFNPLEYEIKLIEPSRDLCVSMSDRFPWIQVVEGHAIHSRLLLQENIMESDVFVAATRDDENNVMSCLQAAKLGIRPCLVTIHRPDYAGILSDIGDVLGITSIVSPRLVTGNELMRFVTTEPFLVLWEMPDKSAQILHVRFNAERSPIYGQRVRDLSWPAGTLILGIERADGTLVPAADDAFLAGDTLLLLTLRDSRTSLLKLFSPAL